MAELDNYVGAKELVDSIRLPNNFSTAALEADKSRVTVEKTVLASFNTLINQLAVTRDGEVVTDNKWTLEDTIIKLTDLAKTGTNINTANYILNLTNLSSNITFPVDATTVSTEHTYQYEVKRIDSSVLGFNDIAIKFKVEPAIQSSAIININNDTISSFNESIDNNIITYSSTVLPQNNNLGIKETTIAFKLESTSINLTSDILSSLKTNGLFASDSIGFQSIKIDPKLEKLTVEQIIAEASSQQSDNFTILPTQASSSIGFNEVEIALGTYETVINLEDTSEITDTSVFNNTVSTITESTITHTDNYVVVHKNSEILTSTSPNNILGYNNINIEVPGNYSYILNTTDNLFTSNTDQTEYYKLQSVDKNYNLTAVYLPKTVKASYTITEDVISSALNDKNVTELTITPTANTVYDEIVLKVPTDISVVNNNLLTRPVFITIQCSPLTSQASLYDKDKTAIESGAKGIDFNIATTDVYSKVIKNTNLYMTTSLPAEINQANNTMLTNYYNNSLNSGLNKCLVLNDCFLVNSIQDTTIQLSIDTPEAYQVNIYECDINGQLISDDTLLLSFRHDGISLDTNEKIVSSNHTNVSFKPNFAITTSSSSIDIYKAVFEADLAPGGRYFGLFTPEGLTAIQKTDIAENGNLADKFDDATKIELNAAFDRLENCYYFIAKQSTSSAVTTGLEAVSTQYDLNTNIQDSEPIKTTTFSQKAELESFFNSISQKHKDNNTNTISAIIPYYYCEFIRQNAITLNYKYDNTSIQPVPVVTPPPADNPEGNTIETIEHFTATIATQDVNVLEGDVEITKEQKVIKTLTYKGITYELERKSRLASDFIGHYIGKITDIIDAEKAINISTKDTLLEEYTFDFNITENTISFYSITNN